MLDAGFRFQVSGFRIDAMGAMGAMNPIRDAGFAMRDAGYGIQDQNGDTVLPNGHRFVI